MDRMENVSILYADIVGFTKMSSNKTAETLVKLLNDLFGRFDELCTKNGCEKISTLGKCSVLLLPWWFHPLDYLRVFAASALAFGLFQVTATTVCQDVPTLILIMPGTASNLASIWLLLYSSSIETITKRWEPQLTSTTPLHPISVAFQEKSCSDPVPKRFSIAKHKCWDSYILCATLQSIVNYCSSKSRW